ncbi:cytochrome P450 [Mycobacterium sp. CVI_P3]|uniref:Cytochrome P450 n=1 Tax=Mycobacterium pinniadriaticum TaxID=2994102 RepID=A0ABT3SF10_9MYCO|nr:cytochrome P450 [Mycobacterium pinniadriaticum]MCX2931821.1 cytochrome P450 [Mycobacterium pinniadriaticum]MCX2938104.1 cytochrome P450 [Mycobacterium pinniadriaticum]
MAEQEFGRDHHNDFDMDSPEFNDNYYDVLNDLVTSCPVAHSKVGKGYHTITGYEDVRRSAEDWPTFTSSKGFQPNRPDDMMKLIPVETDPPYHTIWRKVLNPFFTPGAAAKFESVVEEIVHGAIDDFIESGHTDFVRDVAVHLPSVMFFKTLIGVPMEDVEMLSTHVVAGLLGPVAERGAAWARCGDYVSDYLKTRAAQPPRNDVIDVVVQGFEYDGKETSFDEKVSVVVDLMSGGVGNTAYMLASIAHYLATHPDDRKVLVDDPQKISRAVDEFLRFYSPNFAIGRTCTRDVEISGTELEEGDFVMLSWATANRDPRMFSNPFEVDIERKHNRHIAFGVGPHRCLGSNIAKVQLRVTTRVLLERLPEFEVQPGTWPVWTTSLVREIEGLHLAFPPGQRRASVR